jgi:serine phosphatase RsbU (regulator of sigma subunit)
MPRADAAFWTSVRHHERPEDSVREISELLDRSTRHDVFVALFLARYDARTGEFCYCNAGQPHGLLVSGGDVVRLTEGGPPAGAIPATMGPEYRGGSLALEPGATVLIGTDGVLGDEDVAGRVEKLLLEQGGSLEGLARSVLAEAGAEDDRGIIMLRRHGGGRLSGEGSAGDGEALEGHGSATNRPVS